jgi:hypothetical protein
MKQIIIASALALFSIGSAGAQSLPPNRMLVASTAPVDVAAVAVCETQLQRLAGLNKTLAANYNAEHVRDVCVTEQ